MIIVGCTSNMCWKLQATIQPDPQVSLFLCLFKCVPEWPSIVYGQFLFLVPKCITLHLFTLKVNCHSLEHLVIVSKSDWRHVWSNSSETQFIILASSAYMYIKEVINHIRHITNVTDEKHWPQHRTPWHSTENFNPGWEHAFNYHLLTSWR